MAKTPPNRILLVPVDDTEENERALEWALDNIHKQGDVVQFLHVVHHSHFTSMVQQSEQQEEILVDQAHNWIQERFTHTCDQMGVSYKVLVLKGTTDADSIGQNICHQSEHAGVAVVVMAAHNKVIAENWMKPCTNISGGFDGKGKSSNSSKPEAICTKQTHKLPHYGPPGL